MDTLVVLFSGPHLKDGAYPEPGERGNMVDERRIRKAIRAALDHADAGIAVFGDGNGGSDVAAFMGLARESGVARVWGFYDPTIANPSTFTDASRAVSELAGHPEFSHVVNVLLVTDDWHMARAFAWMHRLLGQRGIQDRFVLHQVPVTDGPRPTQIMLEGEAKGLRDCELGLPSVSYYPPLGKPAVEEDVQERTIN